MKLDLRNEVVFKTSRSGGKGGQNVNKVETQVEARFTISSSTLLSLEQKEMIHQKLHHKLTKEGILILKCNEARTQLENKEKVIEKLNQLITLALIKQKKRIKTKIPKSVLAHRMENKRRRSETKSLRRKLD